MDPTLAGNLHFRAVLNRDTVTLLRRRSVVWSVWADSVDVYLCRGTVWCRMRGAGALSMWLPAPLLPLTAELQRVPGLLAWLLKDRATFRIARGSRQCPPGVPRGATRLALD